MAYLKFKELTQYFNFYKKLDTETLPSYVTDYVSDGEVIHASYSTVRDKILFTNRKIVLFDQKGIRGKTKKIHFFPYKSISSSAIEFKPNMVVIHLSMDSGYQLKLNFIKMSPEGKKEIRIIYFKMIEKMEER